MQLPARNPRRSARSVLVQRRSLRSSCCLFRPPSVRRICPSTYGVIGARSTIKLAPLNLSSPSRPSSPRPQRRHYSTCSWRCPCAARAAACLKMMDSFAHHFRTSGSDFARARRINRARIRMHRIMNDRRSRNRGMYSSNETIISTCHRSVAQSAREPIDDELSVSSHADSNILSRLCLCVTQHPLRASIGYVVHGWFSYQHGSGVALGFVAAESFVQLMQQQLADDTQPRVDATHVDDAASTSSPSVWVWNRNQNSLTYRAAQVQLM
jgi:hypothetical protein